VDALFVPLPGEVGDAEAAGSRHAVHATEAAIATSPSVFTAL